MWNSKILKLATVAMLFNRMKQDSVQAILNKFEEESGINFFSDDYPNHLTFFDKLSLEVIGRAYTYNEVYPGFENFLLSSLKDEYEKITAEEAFFVRYADYYEEREEFVKVSSMFYKMLDEHYETEEMEPYHL